MRAWVAHARYRESVARMRTIAVAVRLTGRRRQSVGAALRPLSHEATDRFAVNPLIVLVSRRVSGRQERPASAAELISSQYHSATPEAI